MISKLIRLIFTILGGLIGYGLFQLIIILLTHAGVDINAAFPGQALIVSGIIFGIIFAFIFFRLTPLIQKQSVKMGEKIGDDLQGISGSDLLASVIGLVFGLVIAFLITKIYAAINNQIVYTVLTIITYLLLGTWA